MIHGSELLFVVDEKNMPLAPKQRHEVHEKGDWHRCSQVFVVNSQGQILCQKRALSVDMYPGMWDVKFGGHLHPEEEYVENAIQELQEELEIQKEKEEFVFFEVYKSEQDKEFQAVYFTKLDRNVESIHVEKEEVDIIEWKDIDDLEEIFKRHDPKWIQHGYELRLLSHLKQVR